MALGGYKFAGRKVTKPEGATDVQWVLLCHKCRVKAFLESNALSSSGWAFDPDQSSGQISFETYGNVIYRLDDLGYNLVSFFKHGDGDAYFAILTLGYYKATADLANGCIAISLQTWLGNAGTYMGIGSTMFCRISRTPLSPSNVLGSISKELYMIPCGRLITGTSFSNGASPSTWDSTATYLDSALSVLYAGFAVKGTNISSFLTYYPASQSINSCHFSVGGYSSLANAGDEDNIFVFNPNVQFQTNLNERLYDRNATGICSQGGFLTVSGTSARYASIMPSMFPHYSGDINLYPFSALNISLYNSVAHNYAKGAVSIDFLAWNSPSSLSSIPNINSTKANGNYLCVTAINGSSYYVYGLNSGYQSNIYPTLYCGWDPSNPDITQESSWTAYTE